MSDLASFQGITLEYSPEFRGISRSILRGLREQWPIAIQF
jgi:hypothetical protein